MRFPLKMNPGRKRLIHAAQQEYRRLHRELAPRLAALPDRDTRNLNVAQNVLRDVLSALLNEMIPYDQATAVELAIRAASYVLSAVPMEDQDVAVSLFVKHFAEQHMIRTAQGAVIPTEWRFADGVDRPNFPEDAG